MGLATLPSASEGVLCIILVNTAVPFSIFKYIIRSLLLMLGIHLDSGFTHSADHGNSSEDDAPTATAESYVEEFRSRTPAVRFDSICKSTKEETMGGGGGCDGVGESEQEEEHDCSVCLMGFEPESEINHLSCGHMFHKVCLEQWLDYWNITCPLCRTPLVTPEDDPYCTTTVW